MRVISDDRRVRVYMANIANGKPVKTHAADAWQEEDGTVSFSGLWAGLVPFAQEDHALMASASNVSPLEWLRLRLMGSGTVSLEIFE